MPKIKLNIGDRPYEISCNEGDEERVLMLAASLNKKVEIVTRSLGSASESMALVVTALMMEDEIQTLSNGNAPLQPQYSENAINERINRCIAEALEPFTQKLESLANSLEV